MQVPPRIELLAELEARQEDVIRRLDELDQQIARALNQWQELKPGAAPRPEAPRNKEAA